MSNHSADKFLAGVLFGALVGAVAGMLTAPRPGKETRERIRTNLEERSSDACKKMESKLQDAKMVVSNRAHSLSRKINEVADHLEENGRRALDEMTASARGGSEMSSSEPSMN